MFKKILSALCVSLACSISASASFNPVLEIFKGSTKIALVDSTMPTDQYIMNLLEDSDAVYITYGRGGHLDGMIQTLEYLDRNPHKVVVIDGPCYSACTLLLAMPNTAYTDNAEFGFHAATSHYCSEGKSKSGISTAANRQMLDVLPDSVGYWVEMTGAFDGVNFTMMSSELMQHYVPELFVHSYELPRLVKTGQSIKNSENPGDRIVALNASCASQ